MPEVFSSQGTSYAEPELAAPDQGNNPQADNPPQLKNRSTRSFLGGVPINKGRAGIVFVIAAIVVVVVFILLNAIPNKRRIARRPVRQQPQQRQIPSDQLPNGPASGPQEGLNPSSQAVTPAAIQKTAENAPKPTSANGGANSQPRGSDSYGQSQSESASSNGTLGQVQPFQPPPVPGSGNGQWVPPPYSGPSARPSEESSQIEERIAKDRREALTKASLVTYFDKDASRSQIAGTSQAASGRVVNSGVNLNFGYRPGYHVSTHLETVASTAISAPVIAVVDYDYQRNGVTIVPAGTRFIGTLGGSNETGIVNLQFNEARLPNGNTVAVSAVGLDHQLMPIKGFVTGRHQIEQFLLSALAGMGSTAAVFAGNNVNGQLTEADLMKMQAANAADTSISNYVSDVQRQVSRTLVVTVPAGKQVEVMFTSETKSTATGSLAASAVK